jgi:hypothetical protein
MDTLKLKVVTCTKRMLQQMPVRRNILESDLDNVAWLGWIASDSLEKGSQSMFLGQTGETYFLLPCSYMYSGGREKNLKAKVPQIYVS